MLLPSSLLFSWQGVSSGFASMAGEARFSVLPSLLISLTNREEWPPDVTCDGSHDLCRVVARRWRDAVFEDPFGRSPGWIKFAEPNTSRIDFPKRSLGKTGRPRFSDG